MTDGLMQTHCIICLAVAWVRRDVQILPHSLDEKGAGAPTSFLDSGGR